MTPNLFVNAIYPILIKEHSSITSARFGWVALSQNVDAADTSEGGCVSADTGDFGPRIF